MQVVVQGAHRRADRHVVVIQNDQQIAIARASVVQGLVSHACGECAIANDSHGFALAAHLFGGHGHAKCSRNAGRRVRGTKGVVNTFFAAWKSAQATQLAHAGHLVVASRQHFVGIGLMADIPDQSIFWRVKNIMQGDGELNRSQVGAKVSSRLRNRLNQTLAQLCGQRRQVVTRQFSELGWGLNPIKQGIHHLP